MSPVVPASGFFPLLVAPASVAPEPGFASFLLAPMPLTPVSLTGVDGGVNTPPADTLGSRFAEVLTGVEDPLSTGAEEGAPEAPTAGTLRRRKERASGVEWAGAAGVTPEVPWTEPPVESAEAVDVEALADGIDVAVGEGADPPPARTAPAPQVRPPMAPVTTPAPPAPTMPAAAGAAPVSVSYTHLTLPTSDLV